MKSLGTLFSPGVLTRALGIVLLVVISSHLILVWIRFGITDKEMHESPFPQDTRAVARASRIASGALVVTAVCAVLLTIGLCRRLVGRYPQKTTYLATIVTGVVIFLCSAALLASVLLRGRPPILYDLISRWIQRLSAL
jgi:cytochrome bd-type quinol oxidase subunit 2